MTLQSDFDDSPIKREIIFPPLTLGWSSDLVWPVRCSRNKNEPFPSPDLLEETWYTVFALWYPRYCLVSLVWSAGGRETT